jgi:hypothetical protein
LTGLVTVEFKVPAGWDPNLVPVVAWQDGKGGWRWLPTSAWKPGQTSVTAQTDHFSSGFLGGFDVAAAARSAVGSFANWITGRAGVAQPKCAGEAGLRTKVAVTSDGGDTVKWCVGVESGRTVLKIANNRLAYTQVTYPAGWKVIAGNRLGLSVDALIQFLATQGEAVQKPRGKAVVLIRSGESVTLSLPDVPDAEVLAEFSQMAYGLQIIDLAGGVRRSVMKSAGQAVKSDGWAERLLKTITNGDASKAWRDAAGDCMKEMTEAYGDNIYEVAKAAEVVKKSAKFALKCAAAMARVSLSESGVGLFLGGLVSGLVDLVMSTIGTALSLLILSAREIWDSVASFGGKSNPIYAIAFAAKIVPTEVIRISPLSASGGVKPGYKVASDAASAVSCAPFGEAESSPAAVDKNIYSCGSTADGTDVCWIDRGGSALCGGVPWEKKLFRVPVTEQDLPSVAPTANPYPWGLQLTDGTRCRLRNGGSWSGRPDGWTGVYYCDGTSTVVLADPSHNFRYLDKSSPSWKVWVGKLDDSAKSLPAPKPTRVAKAYFAAWD